MGRLGRESRQELEGTLGAEMRREMAQGQGVSREWEGTAETRMTKSRWKRLLCTLIKI